MNDDPRKRSVPIGPPLAALGVLLALLPTYLFPVCAVPPDRDPMRCHWSGTAIAVSGILFVLIGLAAVFNPRPAFRVRLCRLATALAVLTGLVPTAFVGMCASPMMPCRIGTLPATMVVLALIVLAALGTILLTRYGGKREIYETDTSDHIQHRGQ